MTDNGGFNLSQLLNPENIRRYLQEQEYAAQNATGNVAPPQPPAIDVPVREVPPPVTLHGTMKVRASFPYDSLMGLSYEQIKQRVYEAIEGRNQGEEWLPVVRLFDVELWVEVVRDESAQRPGSIAAAADAAARGVSEEGHRRLRGDDPDTERRVAEHGPEPDAAPGVGGDADGADRGGEPSSVRGVPGPAGDGPDHRQESGAGGPRGEPVVE